jgi:hypothetical protein
MNTFANRPSALLFFALASVLLPTTAKAVDPATGVSASSNSPSGGISGQGVVGAGTYPLGSGAPSGGPTKINVPTPGNLPLPPGALGNGSATGTATGTNTSLGRYRNAKGEVRVQSLLLDRYSPSVVRVAAKDLSGNVLSRAYGVGIGSRTQFIAAPLSLVLGSSQQWADRIEVTHSAGNRYEAKVAYIDEERNLVLLAPEAAPASLVFGRESDERPNIDVYLITYETGEGLPAGQFQPMLHRAHLAAANEETGLLSISAYPGQHIDDSMAGAGIIDSTGTLIGMLLPDGRGVLSSTLQKAVTKAEKAEPIQPSMIGVILGRGVVVDPKMEGAFRSISAALDAIRKGTAPKTDPSRYNPARNRAVAPKESDKVVIKVMPGTYHEPKTLTLPSHVSLSGSGPGLTTIVGKDPQKPVILVQNAQNVMISGLRIVPANLQDLKAPAVILSKVTKGVLLGNMLESKGGLAVWAHDSHNIGLFGNTFARGQIRGLSCDHTDIQLEGNAFVGDWPIGLSLETECVTVARRNLFFENKNSVSISSLAGSTTFRQNTFVRSPSALRVNGSGTRLTVANNLFFECPYAIYAASDIHSSHLGRNATWKSKMVSKGHPLLDLDLIRSEPLFQDPGNYDFRVRPGSGPALQDLENGIGAYQQTDFVGTFSSQLARSLGAATGDDSFPQQWGLVE